MSERRLLTERRKADRAEMASRLEDLIIHCGAKVTREEMGPREIWLNVEAPRGLRLTLDLDGDSVQPDVHVLSWHMALDSDACLSDRFYGSLNNYHFRKATTIAHGFDELCNAIETCLCDAADGTAFDADREARHIAEHGTAAERKAKWDEYS